MRCFWQGTGLLAAALTGLWAAAGLGADTFEPEKGYTSLFNGKDLTGWKAGKNGKVPLDGKTEALGGRFQVKDGIIVANVGRGIQDLYTVKDYNKDFHLRLEFRAAPRADSGVYIRGKQLQVRDYPTVGPYKTVKFNKGRWNVLDITVKGDKALCKCNGEVVEPAMKVPAKGGIGLQAEVGKFEFRHIQVKELE
jgi:hypothetical protein